MEPTDNELMFAVRDGDPQPFAVLFDRYHQKLFDFFYRLSGDTASSDDLVQEVFLRMLKYRHTFRNDSEFRAWMYRIARSARVDRFRRQKNESPLPVGHDEMLDAGEDSIVLDQLEQQEMSELLRQALLRLPEDKRELLVLARFQELKYEQIATLLDVDVRTIKTRVHRAMLELRNIAHKMTGERNRCVVKKFGK
jgi:RNA polymerase sigma factor (sigma-70 family)